VQVAWGNPHSIKVCAIDPLEVDVAPIAKLVGDSSVETIAHGARQDLQILFHEFDVVADNFIDTQIAAAFAGIADQIGYGNLVHHVTYVRLDKGSQFTNWLKRPITDKQMRYAHDDVRYLHRIWQELKNTLGPRSKWALNESLDLATLASTPIPPEDTFKKIRGWQSLRGKHLAALVELATWREKLARRDNKPPSWIAPDHALADVAKRFPKKERDLERIKGLNKKNVDRYGREMLDVLAQTTLDPSREIEPKAASLLPVEQGYVSAVQAMIAIVAETEGLASKLLGARKAAEEAVRASRSNDFEDISLMKGWRREVIGDKVSAWLRGDAALTKSGVTSVD
jgi:ribonuclease D